MGEKKKIYSNVTECLAWHSSVHSLLPTTLSSTRPNVIMVYILIMTSFSDHEIISHITLFIVGIQSQVLFFPVPSV